MQGFWRKDTIMIRNEQILDRLMEIICLILCLSVLQPLLVSSFVCLSVNLRFWLDRHIAYLNFTSLFRFLNITAWSLYLCNESV